MSTARFFISLRRSLRLRNISFYGATASSNNNSAFPPAAVLDMLVCPLSKEPLQVDRSKSILVSQAAGIGFKFDSDGVINMIPRDAVLLNDEKSRN
jgi:uncharacterized protein YbaR (Trm112 family)